jgi:hypothetical protein
LFAAVSTSYGIVNIARVISASVSLVAMGVVRIDTVGTRASRRMDRAAILLGVAATHQPLFSSQQPQPFV